ncbi:CMRF35-like molecule 5 [Salvelinus alpinus]|uniref:CMRF35-like molecule 5 n=1 Tax=Salvelinus alpinus TaxID=8036 RepID=UPI0039FD81E6
MDSHLSLSLLLLIFSRLSGAYRVSVETGGSITIPCRYDLKYKPHVKYLCKVGHWRICSPDPFKSTDKASISDDINKQTITVTMTDLEPVDSGSYGWFVINGGSDVMIERFQLSVTAGTPELYVDQQEVTGVEGGSVIVKCYYSDTGNRKWCRICVRVQCVWENSGTTEGKSVTLQQTTDATRGNILTVTMSGLKMENTGWYRCGVGDLMMPVHITVRQQTTTQSTTTMTTTKAPTTEQSSFSPSAEPVQTDNTVQGPEGGKEKDTMRWKTTFFYLPKIGNAVLFILCTIIAVVKFRVNWIRGETKDE